MPAKQWSSEIRNFFHKLVNSKVRKGADGLETALEKRFDLNQRYKNLDQPIKINSVKEDGRRIVLKDGSQWVAVRGLGLNQDHAINWSPSQTVIVLGAIRGDSAVYTIENVAINDQSRWAFDGFVEGAEPQ